MTSLDHLESIPANNRCSMAPSTVRNHRDQSVHLIQNYVEEMFLAADSLSVGRSSDCLLATFSVSTYLDVWFNII